MSRCRGEITRRREGAEQDPLRLFAIGVNLDDATRDPSRGACVGREALCGERLSSRREQTPETHTLSLPTGALNFRAQIASVERERTVLICLSPAAERPLELTGIDDDALVDEQFVVGAPDQLGAEGDMDLVQGVAEALAAALVVAIWP
jgi:hypothetical protein